MINIKLWHRRLANNNMPEESKEVPKYSTHFVIVTTTSGAAAEEFDSRDVCTRRSQKFVTIYPCFFLFMTLSFSTFRCSLDLLELALIAPLGPVLYIHSSPAICPLNSVSCVAPLCGFTAWLVHCTPCLTWRAFPCSGIIIIFSSWRSCDNDETCTAFWSFFPLACFCWANALCHNFVLIMWS